MWPQPGAGTSYEMAPGNGMPYVEVGGRQRWQHHLAHARRNKAVFIVGTEIA
jgi:hypothetical protein